MNLWPESEPRPFFRDAFSSFDKLRRAQSPRTQAINYKLPQFIQINGFGPTPQRPYLIQKDSTNTKKWDFLPIIGPINSTVLAFNTFDEGAMFVVLQLG